MKNLSLTIEKIANGYIVTGINGSKEKCFYPTCSELLKSLLMESIADFDEMNRTHKTQGSKWIFEASLNDYVEQGPRDE